MASESDALDQAVSRALRDNLDSVKGAADELNQAIGDLLAACSSNRPGHALPPILRAQAAAASMGGVLDVLSRFLAVTLATSQRGAQVAEVPVVRMPPEHLPAPSIPPPRVPTPMAAEPSPVVTTEEARDMVAEGAPVTLEQPGVGVVRAPMGAVVAPPEEVEEPPVAVEVEAAPAEAPAAEFSLDSLPLDQQEMHRRAKRVAKVSMQDIKMLKPEQVRLGRENKDLCQRLRDDLEKARKEYERRFKTIMDHPTDYFYEWAVEILAGGDPAALGEYPYPRAQTRH